MSAYAHVRARRSEALPGDTVLRSRPGLVALLFAGAAAISAFTILRGGAPFDEGLVLQAGRRVAEGQLPYRDFLWPYGPAPPYLFGGTFELFGTSLLPWRILRVLCDAAVAVTVYALVRREASHRWALLAWLGAACTMAQPTSATPFPPALALGLLAFAVATRAPQTRRTTIAAGALCGLAAAFRLDFAIYAGGAVLAAFALAPLPAARRAADAAVFAAVSAAVALLAYLPFIVVVGPADLYDALVGSSLRERDFWSLPFPLSYEGDLRAWPPGAAAEDAKDVLGFYLPALAVIGLALAAVAGLAAHLRRPAGTWRVGGLLVFCAGGLLYLLSRTDEFHTTPLLVLLAAALPLAIARRPARWLAIGMAGVLALVVTHGLANRLSALLQPPSLDTIDLPVADGAEAPAAEARALERMVATVQRLVPPGEPIYTVTRRSDLVRFNQPLIYVLAERDNPTDRDFGLLARPSDQRRTVAALARARPGAIVRWTDPISVEREDNLRGEPSGSRLLDLWLAREYRLLEHHGEYQVLVPR